MFRVTIRRPNETLRSFYETRKEARRCLERMRKAYKKEGYHDVDRFSKGHAFLIGGGSDFVGISIAEIYDYGC